MAEDRIAAISDERLDWIERWAREWKIGLCRRSRERYYADLPLDVAVDMILELTKAQRAAA